MNEGSERRYSSDGKKECWKHVIRDGCLFRKGYSQSQNTVCRLENLVAKAWKGTVCEWCVTAV